MIDMYCIDDDDDYTFLEMLFPQIKLKALVKNKYQKR